MTVKIATVLLNDWSYWLGRGVIRLLGLRGVDVESMADEPVQPFPAWPRLVHDRDGVRVVSVFGQALVGWLLVLVIAVVTVGVAWLL